MVINKQKERIFILLWPKFHSWFQKKSPKILTSKFFDLTWTLFRKFYFFYLLILFLNFRFVFFNNFFSNSFIYTMTRTTFLLIFFDLFLRKKRTQLLIKASRNIWIFGYLNPDFQNLSHGFRDFPRNLLVVLNFFLQVIWVIILLYLIFFVSFHVDF